MPEPEEGDPYRLQVGDQLLISIWGRPESDFETQIREAGSVLFPPTGEVPAAGRTVEELEQEIQVKLDAATEKEIEAPLPEASQPAQVLPRIAPTEAMNHAYRLQAGDQIDIRVWDHDNMNQRAQIREDGSFSFPLIGNVKAAGRPLPDVEKEIVERLNKDFIVNPQVSARLAGAQFYVLGQKEESGSHTIEGTVTLLSAISAATNLASLRSSRIEVIRYQEDRQIVIVTDMGRLLSGKDPNIPVLPRDTIYIKAPFVQETPRKVSVRLVEARFTALGEVERPGAQPIAGPMDLLTAVSLAGGVTKFGSNRVEIIRSRGNEKIVIQANIDRILQGKEPNIRIYPRDTIYVKRRLF